MNTDAMLNATSDFLCRCLELNKVGSVATVEYGGLPGYYFQFFVCGDERDAASGDIQAQIVGPENSGVTEPESVQRFARVLKSGWSLEGGNADRVFGPFSEVDQIKTLVQTAADLLLAIYGLEAALWSLDCYEEE